MMNIPTTSNVIVGLFNMIDGVLKHYVCDGYNALANHLKYPLAAAIVLYISLLGVSITQGWVRLSGANLTKIIFKISLIYLLAMSWGNFSFYVVKAIQGSAGQVGYWLVSATSLHFSHSGNLNVNAAIQAMLSEVSSVGSWAWEQGSFHNWGPYFTAMFVWFFGCGTLALAVVEIIVAQMMLAILFTLAPLFICFTLFKVTHGMFDRWLGAVCGFALFLVFVPAAVALTLALLQWTVKGYYVSHTVNLSMLAFIPLMIVSVLSVVLIFKVTACSKLIGGSISTIGFSSLVAEAVAGSAAGFAGAGQIESEKAGSTTQMAASLAGKPVNHAFNAIRNRLRGGG